MRVLILGLLMLLAGCSTIIKSSSSSSSSSKNYAQKAEELKQINDMHDKILREEIENNAK